MELDSRLVEICRDSFVLFCFVLLRAYSLGIETTAVKPSPDSKMINFFHLITCSRHYEHLVISILVPRAS